MARPGCSQRATTSFSGVASADRGLGRRSERVRVAPTAPTWTGRRAIRRLGCRTARREPSSSGLTELCVQTGVHAACSWLSKPRLTSLKQITIGTRWGVTFRFESHPSRDPGMQVGSRTLGARGLRLAREWAVPAWYVRAVSSRYAELGKSGLGAGRPNPSLLRSDARRLMVCFGQYQRGSLESRVLVSIPPPL